MSALLLDIGNSRLKWGVYDGVDIVETGDIPQSDISSRGLSVLTSRLPLDVDDVWASNVAGASFAARLKAIIDLHAGCEVHFARVSKTAFGLTTSYAEPRRLGIDRWVAMIGAWAEEPSACLIVDVGTAVTIDAIDDDGLHLGGQILPGFRLMASALADGTSDIPLVSADEHPGADRRGSFGDSTSAAVLLGVSNAILGAIERATRALSAETVSPRIVLTGGDASRILTALDEPPQHRPNLVLSGLAHIYKNHR